MSLSELFPKPLKITNFILLFKRAVPQNLVQSPQYFQKYDRKPYYL